MELIDGVFHQLSKDNALVAITADYPGLLPASQVTETESQHFEKGSVLVCFRLPYDNHVLQGRSLRREAEPAVTSQRGAARPHGLKRSAVRTETLAQRYSAPSYSWVLFLQGILTLVLSLGQRDLARLYSERLPIAPPPARLQSLVRRRRRTQGAHQTLLRRGCGQVVCHQL